jgi:hypothetical protein
MVEQIFRSLGRHADADFYRNHRQQGKTVVQAAVAIWTDHNDEGTNPVFKALNRALLYDELECLEKWMVLVRLNAHWLNRSETRINEDTVVWRGSKLTHEQAARLQENAIIRPPIFVATTHSREQAHQFVGGDGYLVKCTIRAGCPNAGRVQQISSFAQEEEVLIPPYSPFRIIGIQGQQINTELLDGGALPLDLPSHLI